MSTLSPLELKMGLIPNGPGNERIQAGYAVAISAAIYTTTLCIAATVLKITLTSLVIFSGYGAIALLVTGVLLIGWGIYQNKKVEQISSSAPDKATVADTATPAAKEKPETTPPKEEPSNPPETEEPAAPAKETSDEPSNTHKKLRAVGQGLRAAGQTVKNNYPAFLTVASGIAAVWTGVSYGGACIKGLSSVIRTIGPTTILSGTALGVGRLLWKSKKAAPKTVAAIQKEYVQTKETLRKKTEESSQAEKQLLETARICKDPKSKAIIAATEALVALVKANCARDTANEQVKKLTDAWVLASLVKANAEVKLREKKLEEAYLTAAQATVRANPADVAKVSNAGQAKIREANKSLQDARNEVISLNKLFVKKEQFPPNRRPKPTKSKA
ncbi:MAG: hypothetical protein HZB76_00720 [Chlamydiae bacterium]|nr:hypothetical protein [Chlamydiota bacterium]